MMYQIESFKKAISQCAEKAVFFKPMLTLLDNYSGDGDMGISIEKGAKAVKKVLCVYKGTDIGELFDLCGKHFNQAASSTIGTLISAALFMLGRKFHGKSTLDEHDVVLIPTYMADAISMSGHAKLGDKTILDALCPFAEALLNKYQESGDLTGSAQEAAKIAKEAAKSTRGMIATIGRAKWIGERSRDYPDPGAVLCSILIDSIVRPEKELGYKLPEYEK